MGRVILSLKPVMPATLRIAAARSGNAAIGEEVELERRGGRGGKSYRVSLGHTLFEVDKRSSSYH